MTVNVWLSVLATKSLTVNREFPYEAQLLTGKWVTITSREDIWENLKDLDEAQYDAACFLADLYHLYDSTAQEMIQRYSYCKEHGMAPYPGSYEEQPIFWVKATKLISREISKAGEYKNSVANNKVAAQEAVNAKQG